MDGICITITRRRTGSKSSTPLAALRCVFACPAFFAFLCLSGVIATSTSAAAVAPRACATGQAELLLHRGLRPFIHCACPCCCRLQVTQWVADPLWCQHRERRGGEALMAYCHGKAIQNRSCTVADFTDKSTGNLTLPSAKVCRTLPLHLGSFQFPPPYSDCQPFTAPRSPGSANHLLPRDRPVTHRCRIISWSLESVELLLATNRLATVRESCGSHILRSPPNNACVLAARLLALCSATTHCTANRSSHASLQLHCMPWVGHHRRYELQRQFCCRQ